MCWFTFGCWIWLHWFTCLFLYQYHVVFPYCSVVQLSTRYGDTLGRSFIVQYCRSYPGWFSFSIWSWVLFLWDMWRTVLRFWWGFHWICRLLFIRCHFYYINPTNLRACRTLHLWISPAISVFKDLKFLSYRSFACWVRATPRYFILFVATVKGVAFLTSFSVYLFFVYSHFWFQWNCFEFLSTLWNLLQNWLHTQ